MTDVSQDEEERWARALAVLDSTPPEPAHRQAARERYDRRAARVAVVLAGTALALALIRFAVDPSLDDGEDAPTWRVVTGSCLGVAGGVLMLAGPLARPYGSQRGLRRPLASLSSVQRKVLQRQVRGRVPVERGWLPLARLQARVLLENRGPVLRQTGLTVCFVGFWTAHHDVPRTILTLLMVVGLALAVVVLRREERFARRFLAQHPAPDAVGGPAGRSVVH